MTGVIICFMDLVDGVCIEREQPSTPSELMALIQRLFDLKRGVPQAASREARNSSWRADYLQQQLEDAKKKAAEELAAADESNRFDEQSEVDEAARHLAETAALESNADQVAAKKAAYEEQKQNYKENADFVYEGTGNFIDDCFDTSNWFLDVGEGVFYTGAGDDVIYQHGPGKVFANQGNDIVYASQDYSGSLLGGDVQTIFLDAKANLEAMCGEYGDDVVHGGEGSQKAYGMLGNDYFDLGNGHDIASGGSGADEFIVDLSNTGRDTIIDFVDVGDKITIHKDGQAAQAGDWYLTKSEIYSGMSLGADDYAVPYFTKDQQFYRITSSSGDIAAIFPIAAKAGNATSVPTNTSAPMHYQLTVSLDFDGLEILSSCQCANQDQASLQFL